MSTGTSSPAREPPASLEPPGHLGENGAKRRDFRRLVGLVEQRVAAIGDRAPRLYVWYCVLRTAPQDPDLGDGTRCDIIARVMDRTRLSVRGREHEGIRWIAVHHGDNHVHIVATLGGAANCGLMPIHRSGVANSFLRPGPCCAKRRPVGTRSQSAARSTAAKFTDTVRRIWLIVSPGTLARRSAGPRCPTSCWSSQPLSVSQHGSVRGDAGAGGCSGQNGLRRGRQAESVPVEDQDVGQDSAKSAG